MTVQKRNLILVFDTNIFLTGIDFSIIPSQIYTTPQVLEEIEVARYEKKNENIINKILAAVESRKLIIKLPSDTYYNRVQESSKLSGDYKKLSKIDIGVIALALELKENDYGPIIVYSNDYSIENLCSHLNITFKSFLKPGIKKKMYFEIYCPSCKKVYNMNNTYEECIICGTKLKRRISTSK